MKPLYYTLLALFAWGAIQRAVAVGQGNPQGVERANMHLQAGVYYMERAHYDSTIGHLRLCIAQTSSADPMRSPAYVLMTHCFKALAIRDSAMFYARKVIQWAEIQKDSSLQAEYLYTLGSIYAEHNNPRHAEGYYLQSARLAEKIGRHSKAKTSYAAAADICTEPKRAVELYEQAIKCAKKIGDKTDMASLMLGTAAAYYNDGQLQRASDSYRQAMDYCQQVQDTNGYQMAQSGLMFLFNKSGQQDSAWAYMNEREDEFVYNADSLAPPNSMQGVKLDLLVATANAEERAVQLGVLSRQYWQDQAESLKTKLWLIALASGLMVLVLLLLYGRQRLRSKARARYIEGLEGERERIAKELHDGVCNDLLAVEMGLCKEVSLARLGALQTVRREVRLLSHELMPPAFQYASIDEILLDYTTQLVLPQGCMIDFVHHQDTPWGEVSHTLAFQIYRIVQEAIANSIKHASPTQIEVVLSQQGRQIKLTVADNGVGFDPKNNSNGVGLRTLKDRATSIGGAVAIDTTPHGTTLIFTYNNNGTKGKHIAGRRS